MLGASPAERLSGFQVCQVKPYRPQQRHFKAPALQNSLASTQGTLRTVLETTLSPILFIERAFSHHECMRRARHG
jgi:hypothetical protein